MLRKFVMFLLLVGLVFGLFKLSMPINTATTSSGKAINGSKTISLSQNILLLGLDASGMRADTIMLVTMIKGKVSVLSIPRDTKVSGGHKINALYQQDGRESALMQAIQGLTGLPINYYVSLKPKAFKHIIDDLGGIEYDVPMDMQYTNASGKYKINLKKGKQHLTGSQAEQLVRFRKGYAMQDIGRVGTQQEFIKELIRQKANFKNTFGIIKALNNSDKYVKSNMSYLKAITIALRYKNADIESYTLPGTPATAGVSFWIPNDKELVKVISKMRGEE